MGAPVDRRRGRGFSLLDSSSFPCGGRLLSLPGVAPMTIWSVNADSDKVLDDPNLYRSYFTAPSAGSIPYPCRSASRLSSLSAVPMILLAARRLMNPGSGIDGSAVSS